MKFVKLFAAITALLCSLTLNTSALAGAGSFVDMVLNTTQATVYHDGPYQRPVDTTFMYEKYSDYYCITSFGQELCGYDCRPGDTHAECGSTKQSNCVKNDYGVVNCGYDCQVDGHDMVCGSDLSHNCLKNSFGKMVCGEECNCHGGIAGCDHVHAHNYRHPYAHMKSYEVPAPVECDRFKGDWDCQTLHDQPPVVYIPQNQAPINDQAFDRPQHSVIEYHGDLHYPANVGYDSQPRYYYRYEY